MTNDSDVSVLVTGHRLLTAQSAFPEQSSPTFVSLPNRPPRLKWLGPPADNSFGNTTNNACLPNFPNPGRMDVVDR
jgi:hypothetical protein